jgi:16S rRNA (guanine966-N2)-methyltransferase
MPIQILFGAFKGRQLKTPKDMAIRPTTARMRDWLCNVMREDFDDRRVLDLFAGCGTLGLHALSLGASSVLFVDSAAHAINLLKMNIERTASKDRCEILKSSVERFLKGSGRGRFDLVFVDPPYDTTDYAQLMEQLAAADLLEPDALLVVEHPSNRPAPDFDLSVYKKKKFGRSTITIFRNDG